MATSRRTLLARLVAVQSLLLFVVDPDRFYTVHGLWGAVERFIQRLIIPSFELAVIGALVVKGLSEILRKRRKIERPGVPPRRFEEETTSAAPG